MMETCERAGLGRSQATATTASWPRPGVERDGTFERRDGDTVHDGVDRAHRAKYRRYGDTYLEAMLGAFVSYTDDVLFGQVWERPQLSPKERSLITVAALTTGGNTEQLTYHLDLALQNGATETELIEAITHLAFYAGWPKAMSAMAVAKQVFQAG
ncbi:MAG: carboxymuconolactone decarboxylase family protein [Nocardioidaceae bacterium]